MRKVRKYITNNNFESDKELLESFDNYIAYIKDTKTIGFKGKPKPTPKTMKFVFGENEINAIKLIKEEGLAFSS